jgi:hypothetical protein
MMRRVLIVLIAVFAVVLSQQTTAQAQTAQSKGAAPGIAPPGADTTATYLDTAGKIVPKDESPAAAQRAAAFGCTPGSGRDNPHRSSTGVAVSAHGWWTKGSCTANTAHVFNCLYEWYTDNTWRQKACSPTKQLSPGGGSANRTVARANCSNTLNTSWRNHVDVDVDGQIDTAEAPYNQASVLCRVF